MFIVMPVIAMSGIVVDRGQAEKENIHDPTIH
jgi:hypothetical protein